MGEITFRPLARADFPLLARWLAQPHVARWWNHEYTAAAVERDFGPPVDGLEPGADSIVLRDGRPIGLIQCSRFSDHPDYSEELRPLLTVPENAVTLDYLIGEPDLVGQGVGTAMLSAFVTQVWETTASCIIVPVNSANTASWRALQKAGFRIAARGDLAPDNPLDSPAHVVLRLDRS